MLNKEKKYKRRQEDLKAPYKARFLQRMFKNNDFRLATNNTKQDPNDSPGMRGAGSRLTSNSGQTASEVAENFKPKSRMQIDRQKVKSDILGQIRLNEYKKQ